MNTSLRLAVPNNLFSYLVIFVIGFCSCTGKADKNIGGLQFTSLPSSQTGISFNNIITENDSVNLIENEYTYMGGGVGIGDFNNDNLPDIFFSASQQPCKLYINKGDFKFLDATGESGIRTNVWATGVSIIDINDDGYDDIYLCVSGSKNWEQRKKPAVYK